MNKPDKPRLIRIVKLARVPYGELDEGDEYEHVLSGRVEKSYARGVGNSSPVPAYDTAKYKPEYVTYTIEGLDADNLQDAICAGKALFLADDFLDESEIETRYI